MLVEDRDISDIIVKLSKHYTDNISTRFLRPLFTGILSDTTMARRISELTEHSESFILQGFRLDDLYDDILALAQFIFLIRRDILPNISNLRDENIKTASADKVYRSMAFNNLSSNIKILVDILNDLYVSTIAYDKKTAKNRTVASGIPDLKKIGNLLVEKA